jgi:hypothetical protein
MPEYDGRTTQIKVMSFGFDGHGMNNGLFECCIIPRVSTNNASKIDGVFLAQA